LLGVFGWVHQHTTLVIRAARRWWMSYRHATLGVMSKFTRFWTENSLYEVDHARYAIRRLAGRSAPTPRQARDGEWQTYEEISRIEIDLPVLVTWRTDDTPRGEVRRQTETSLVVGIADGETQPPAWVQAVLTDRGHRAREFLVVRTSPGPQHTYGADCSWCSRRTARS
jgi:hypothetical protein